MNEEHIGKFDDYLRKDITKLETKRGELEKKLSKLTQQFNVDDIHKLDKLANEISSINHTINRLYMLIGSMHSDLK